MKTTLAQLREERATLVGELETLMGAEDFDPSESTFTERRSYADKLDGRIKMLVDWEASRNAANEIDAQSVRVRKEIDVQRRDRDTDEGASLGELWTRSKAYEDYMQAPRGTSGRIKVPFDTLIQQRAPILTTTFTGLIQPDRIAPSAPPPSQTPLLSLISRIRVGANSVEWVFFPAAAPLGTVTAEGVTKTEAAITPSLKTVTLDTIASWAQYSRQFGEDAPGLVDFLNASLARGITDKMEALAAATLVADATIPITTNTAGTLLGGIRRAVATIQAAGYGGSISAAVNPQDYAALDIDLMARTLNGSQVNASYWGVNIVPVGALASGTAYVGNFPVAMAELVRSDVSVYTSDSHANTFISNVLTTLVEIRAKAIVHRPEALTKVTGTVPAALEAQSGRK
jgi:HK97 family phage major capsid protein